MPHKGVLYPFHPEFWATECWFWPNFVPWKIVFVQEASITDPWRKLNLPQTAVSPPGEVSTDRKRITYSVDVETSDGPGVMKCFTEKGEVEGRPTIHIEVVLSIGGVDVGRSWSEYLYPGPEFSFAGFAFGQALPSGDDIPPAPTNVEFAVYAVGGSPWD